MARQRNPKRDEARKIWLESGGAKKLTEIAAELDVSDVQIRKWKSIDKWDAELNGNVTNQKERYHSAKGNNNAAGNAGNKRASPPKGNKNAVSHGLFSNWLPDESREIMAELYSSEPADIIWNNIMIQYTAIIRSQKIMNVTDQLDLSNEVSGMKGTVIMDKEGNPIVVPTEKAFAVQYAWDKQAAFLQAQSRAMSTLSNLIKQFVAISDERDERRLKLDLMQSQITKLKTETKEDSSERTYIVDDIEEIKAGEDNE